MSFSEDPFKHITIKVHDEKFIWECNKCGADSSRGNARRKAEIFDHTTPINDIVSAFWIHITQSHKMTPEDTKDWS